MIKLTHERHSTKIPGGLRGHHRKNKELLLLKERRDGGFNFKSNYWKAAKSQLMAEAHDKCAYCESKITVVAYGDVDHFRPKSVYWWLAYCYDNYLYSCQKCNEMYKLDHFPLRGVSIQEPVVDTHATDAQLDLMAGTLAPDPLNDSQGLPMATFTQQREQELASLVDPYLFDPETLFAWKEDDVLEEVRLIPRNNSMEATSAAQAAETYLGINREELCEARWQEYHYLETLKDALKSGQLPALLAQRMKDDIKKMLADESEYAGMVRYYVKTVWNLDLG